MGKRETGWIVIVVGAILLAIIAGTLWKLLDIQKEDTAAWRDIFIATTTPKPTLGRTSLGSDIGEPSDAQDWYEHLMVGTPTP